MGGNKHELLALIRLQPFDRFEFGFNVREERRKVGAKKTRG